MAAVMNCDIHLTDKLAVYKREVDKLGIKTIAPCVNASLATFTVRDGAVVYGLGALKNVGVDAMQLIVAGARGDKPFATLFDFARRVDLKRIGKRPLEMLARAGAFDAARPQPRPGVRGAGSARRLFRRDPRGRASSQVSLFGEAGADIPEPRLPVPRRLAAGRTAGAGTSGDRLLPLRPPAGRLHVRAEAQEASRP